MTLHNISHCIYQEVYINDDKPSNIDKMKQITFEGRRNIPGRSISISIVIVIVIAISNSNSSISISIVLVFLFLALVLVVEARSTT